MMSQNRKMLPEVVVIEWTGETVVEGEIREAAGVSEMD